jgi:hypothetical protein
MSLEVALLLGMLQNLFMVIKEVGVAFTCKFHLLTKTLLS